MLWRHARWSTLPDLNDFWFCLVMRPRYLMMLVFLSTQGIFNISMVWGSIGIMWIWATGTLSWTYPSFYMTMNTVISSSDALVYSRMLDPCSDISMPRILGRLVWCVPPEKVAILCIHLEVVSGALGWMAMHIWMIHLVCNLNKRWYIIDFPKFFLIFVWQHFYE